MKMAVEDYRMITFYSGECMKNESGKDKWWNDADRETERNRDDRHKELRRDNLINREKIRSIN